MLPDNRVAQAGSKTIYREKSNKKSLAAAKRECGRTCVSIATIKKSLTPDGNCPHDSARAIIPLVINEMASTVQSSAGYIKVVTFLITARGECADAALVYVLCWY